ncbi:MAG TPA: hypothetical protein PK054_06075 [Anaerohalosphaeraceae bacterium]|nr:hypothetical protein [Anaerohalosphaeraceae bacterium]HPP56135.1 hypothetical protein [Anaerohalosphaeraceae bacterium]
MKNSQKAHFFAEKGLILVLSTLRLSEHLKKEMRSRETGDGNMLGIEDKGVLLAYLLCIGSSILCVLYGLFARNKGDEPVKPEDLKWVSEEKKVEENL